MQSQKGRISVINLLKGIAKNNNNRVLLQTKKNCPKKLSKKKMNKHRNKPKQS